MNIPILSNAHAKHLAQLKVKKYREERQEFLVEGIRLCEELFRSDWNIQEIVIRPQLRQHPIGQKIVENARYRAIPILEASQALLEKLSDTEEPQPIIACVKKQQPLPLSSLSLRRLVVLLDLADPGNVGTILRTAEAFEWSGVVCVDSTVDLYNSKVVRASMGAIFRIPFACISLETLLSFFKDTCLVLTVLQHGEPPPYNDLPDELALILGNEAHGLPNSLNLNSLNKVRRFQLPMANAVDSLNVAVAAGIFLFLLKK